MKRYLLITTLLLIMVGQLFAQQDEKDAIMNVISLETSSYIAKDYEQWKDCWHTEGDILFMYVTNQQMYLYDSWKDLENAMEASFKGDANHELQEAVRTQVQMTLNEGIAWVRFNQNDNGRITKEQRILEKINGNWKICNMTAVNVTSFGIEVAGNDD